MTYQLTSEEMEIVRDMVRILVSSADIGIICAEDEKTLFRLAEKLDPIIR